MKFPTEVFPSFFYACYIDAHQSNYDLVLEINLTDNVVGFETSASIVSFTDRPFPLHTLIKRTS